MTLAPYRTALTFFLLAVAYAASLIYDTLIVQEYPQIQTLLGASIAACFAGMLVLVPYPRQVLMPLLLSSWPLHLYCASVLFIIWGFHGGWMLGQAAFYTPFAYAMYLLLPLVLFLDRRTFTAFTKMVGVTSAGLALPSFWGAMGHQHLFGIPLRLKFSYSDFSGIIASAGLFEHAEGHAFQMAIGALCCYYLLRSGEKAIVYGPCLLLTLAGLVISQGRAVILGLVIAGFFALLPELFRRSRPIFLGTLAVVLIFPVLILPQIASVPGVGRYLRAERGLSGREEAWQFALAVIKEKPWTGHGFMASTELTELESKRLRKSGFSGAGTTFHNTFISKSVDLGLAVTGVYTLLYLLPLIRICVSSRYRYEQELLRSMLLLTLTASIFRDYNIGGIRSTAMLSAAFLGACNLWPMLSERGWGLQDTRFHNAPSMFWPNGGDSGRIGKGPGFRQLPVSP
ncbi:MAG: O-antigen ligase family protein [Pirellulaceae bacterium]